MNITRRIIAISISLCGGIVLAILSLKGNEIALASLTGLVGIVLGFYFGNSSKP